MTPVDPLDEEQEAAPTGAASEQEKAPFAAVAGADAAVDDAASTVFLGDSDENAGPALRGGGWTLPLLCAGLCLLACCVVIPQVDLNRRAAYERLQMQLDLASVRKQVSVNAEFLKKIGDDPTLAERLAERQMKIVREGTQVLDIGTRASTVADMSPYQITHVPRPQPLPAYRPIGGVLTSVCCAPRSRLYLMGLGLFMVASGLVLGFSPADATASDDDETSEAMTSDPLEPAMDD